MNKIYLTRNIKQKNHDLEYKQNMTEDFVTAQQNQNIYLIDTHSIVVLDKNMLNIPIVWNHNITGNEENIIVFFFLQQYYFVLKNNFISTSSLLKSSSNENFNHMWHFSKRIKLTKIWQLYFIEGWILTPPQLPAKLCWTESSENLYFHNVIGLMSMKIQVQST